MVLLDGINAFKMNQEICEAQKSPAQTSGHLSASTQMGPCAAPGSARAQGREKRLTEGRGKRLK